MTGGEINWDKVAMLLIHFSPWILVDILFLAGFFAYFIFAVVVLTQIFAMTRTVSSPLNFLVRLAGFIHLVFALGILLFMIGII